MRFLVNLILFSFLCSIGTLMSSCEPETIFETEIITVTDTVVVTTTDTVFVSSTDTIFIPDEAKVTHFILVRHAEKSSAGNDPGLTVEGLERAKKLADILAELELDRVYSTNYNRTKQTALPTADRQGLSITNYGGFDHHSVIEDILANVHEGKVLIVGHSNTTPNFLNALTGTSKYADLDEGAYDDLFIVNVKSKGDAEVIHLNY